MTKDDINMQLFARNLKELRNARMMTADELATQIGLSERSVTQMESGSRLTSLPTLIAICNVLKANPDRLLNVLLEKEYQCDPTSYEQLIDMISYMTPQEVNLVLEIMKSIKKYPINV